MLAASTSPSNPDILFSRQEALLKLVSIQKAGEARMVKHTHLYPWQLRVLDLIPVQQHLLFFFGQDPVLWIRCSGTSKCSASKGIQALICALGALLIWGRALSCNVVWLQSSTHKDEQDARKEQNKGHAEGENSYPNADSGLAK
eukprot:1152165-Pelagomonas_calceolata.AAC.3